MPNLQLACTYIKSLILILSLLKNNKIQVWIKSLKTATQETFILIIIIVGGWVTSKTNNNWVNKLCYMLYQLKNTDSTIFALKKIDFCIKTRFSRSSQSYQDILVGGRIKKKALLIWRNDIEAMRFLVLLLIVIKCCVVLHNELTENNSCSENCLPLLLSHSTLPQFLLDDLDQDHWSIR